MAYKQVHTRVKRRWRSFAPLLVVVLLLALGGLWLVHRHTKSEANKTTQTASGVRPQNTVDYSPATPTDNNTNESRKTSTSPSSTLNSSSSSSSSPGSSMAVKMNATVTDNKTIHVGTLITGATSGTCTLTATQPGQQNVVITSQVQQDVNTYDCGPMNPQLPSSGKWNLTLKVVSGSTQASDTATVTI